MNSFFKDKKIVAYIALTHHTRFLVPIMEKLEKLGAQVMYIVGQAERSQEITAIETRINYVHVFDYISEEDRDEIKQNYRILRDGFAKGIKKEQAVASTVAVTVLDKCLHASTEEYIGFKNFLKKEKPDICFALHELNRWSKMMCFWAKTMDIPVLTLQEGLYVGSNHIYIGHVQFATLNLVWGKKTHEKLVTYEAPEEKIIPVGNTHIAQEIINLEKNNTRAIKRDEYHLKDKQVILLLFSAQPSSVDDLSPLLDYLLENNDLQLIIKFHPITTLPIIEQWQGRISDPVKEKIIFVHSEENTYNLMAMSDLCVLSEPSTTGLEALAIGRPLIQLKLTKPDRYPYNFVKEKVALRLTPGELTDKLKEGVNFTDLFSSTRIKQFIEDELCDTTGATDRVLAIAQKVIQAKTDKTLTPFPVEKTQSGEQFLWSIILPVSENPENFLSVLESISSFSEDAGPYEVVLLLEQPPSNEIETILGALEGNIKIITSQLETPTLTELLNEGACQSAGQRLVFMDKDIAPSEKWLKSLDHAYEQETGSPIFGAKIVNPHNNILHAGIVLDTNHAPVPAYQHLDDKFPPAQKKRPFQMVDWFLSMDKTFFNELGGFHPKTGRYGFLDLCLRAGEKQKNATVFYIPEIKLIRLSSKKRPVVFDESIQFFSRWYSVLWENEWELYQSDGISQFQLESARMTRAMDMVKTQ